MSKSNRKDEVQDDITPSIELIPMPITGKTKIGSHEEVDAKTGEIVVNPNTGKPKIINDYDFAVVTVNVPVRIVDMVEFYGLDRLCKLAKAHEIVLLGNITRATLPDSKGKPQIEKNAIAQKAIGDDYPVCLDAKIKVPGAKRVSAKIKTAIEARATAMAFMEALPDINKPFDQWAESTKEKFNKMYPMPSAE